MSGNQLTFTRHLDRRSMLWGGLTLIGVAISDSIAASALSLPQVRAYRSPGCGCCEQWAARMTEAGFTVSMKDDANLTALRERAGVPAALAGCHTAFIGDYLFEGHVPPADIIQFLRESPSAKGLAVPGMPRGAPGMEQGGAVDPHQVILFNSDGSTAVYHSYT